MSATQPGIEDADPAYAGQIAELVATHITSGYRGLSHVPLLTKMGCRSVVRDRGSWSVSAALATNPANEALIRSVLLQALNRIADTQLRFQADNFALLHGLSQDLRWRACLTTADDSFSLAALFLWHAIDRSDASDASKIFRENATRWLVEMLNEWIHPSVPYAKCPDIMEIGSALFGEAWLQFCVIGAGVRSLDIPDLVYNTRPPFRPDLVSFNLDTADVYLPAMDAP